MDCQDDLLSVALSNSSFIIQSFFSSVTIQNSIFFLTSVNFLIIFDTKLSNSSSFAVFYLVSVALNLNRGFLIINCQVTNVWSTDHTCLTTEGIDSMIENNIIFSKVFYLFSLPYSNLFFSGMHIRNNNFTSFCMIIMLVGHANFSKSIFTNNYFLNSTIYSYVFDFEMENLMTISFCYFQENGPIDKKTFYMSKTDNNLFNFFIIKLTFFTNCVFVKADMNG